MLGPDPENHMLANIPRQRIPELNGNVKPKPIARQGQLADHHLGLVRARSAVAVSAFNSSAAEAAFFENEGATFAFQRTIEEIHRWHANETGHEAVVRE